MGSVADDARTDPAGDRRWRAWVGLGALAAITAFATRLRWEGLTDLSLYTDDAWAAMPSRVGLGTAVRMGVTAPGYSLAERTWIQLRPGSAGWAQLPALGLGIVAVVVTYALVRSFRLPRWIALLGALVVATGPVMVAYATHVKEYSADFVLTCLLLIVGEASRRSPRSFRLLATLAALSVGGFIVSASVAIVIAAVWTALLIDAVADRDRDRWRRLLATGGVAALAGAIVAGAVLSHLPPSLHGFWLDRGFFPDLSSIRSAAGGLRDALTAVVNGLGLWPGHVPPGILADAGATPARVAILLVALGLAGLGLSTGRQAIAPALVLVAAVTAWLVAVVPLGTGRTDVVLYPPLLLLMAMGAHRLSGLVNARLPARGPIRVGVQATIAFGLVVWAAVLVVQPGVARERYPAVDTRTLAAHISGERQPGDVVVVAPGARYTWGYAEAPDVDVRFGGQWTMGFTLESREPGTFIAPECATEPGYDPDAWAETVRDATRIWYVGSSSICDPDPDLDRLYQALLAEGFRPVERVDAASGYVVRLERVSA